MLYRDLTSGAVTNDFFTAQKWFEAGSDVALVEVREDGEYVITEWKHR